MGDRISIQFENGNERSVVLFSHWGGEDFMVEAKKYVKTLKEEVGQKKCTPIERLEPNTVMVDFIRAMTKGMKRVESDLYLGATEMEGDNSDNGHYIINLDKDE